MPRAVLLNDTSATPHHGSRLVVATIRNELSKRGVDIVATAHVGAHWNDTEFQKHLSAADVVVINGEGTLHHGGPVGGRLLQAADRAARDHPVALINAMWQENPSAWADLLRRVRLICVRDGRSQRELACDGIQAELCPDLSFLHPAPQVTREPDRAAFGDCVRRDAAAALFAAYQDHKGPKLYLPIRSLRRHKEDAPSVGQRLANLKYRLRAGAQAVLDRNRVMVRDVDEYVSHVGHCGLHVTGRYHAACLSIVAGTPFAAVPSNSHKIEALIEDVGLERSRLASSAQEAALRAVPWSADELDAIEAWLARARHSAAGMFDRIAALGARKPLV